MRLRLRGVELECVLGRLPGRAVVSGFTEGGAERGLKRRTIPMLGSSLLSNREIFLDIFQLFGSFSFQKHLAQLLKESVREINVGLALQVNLLPGHGEILGHEIGN